VTGAAAARTIVLAAGGTGGHVMPAAALAQTLTAAGYPVTWITDPRGQRYRDAFPAGTTSRVQAVASHMAGGPLGKVKALAQLAVATAATWLSFLRQAPRLVIGFGGYPSMPAVLAARLAGVPVIIHEQNAVLGRVNRWLGRGAIFTAHGMPTLAGTRANQPAVFVGNPVRGDVAAAVTDYAATGLASGDGDRGSRVSSGGRDVGGALTIVIVGGSQGAHVLSTLIPAGLARLPDGIRSRLRVMHQARPEDAETVKSLYADAGITAEVAPFFTEMGRRLASAQLVIARAGASTLAEISLHGRPAILLPLPAAAHDHQRFNTVPFVDAGAAWVLDERSDRAAEDLDTLLAAILAEDEGLRMGAAAAMASLGVHDATDRFMTALAPIIGAP